MNLHEYQSKELFRSYGIPVPDGKVAFSADEAVAAAESLTTDTGSTSASAKDWCGY